jgi:hypothetical protein
VRAVLERASRLDYEVEHTKVTRLVVEDVPEGGTVTVACKGRGCPFRIKLVAVRAARRR